MTTSLVDWALVFNSMSDLAMILDLDHRIVEVNSATLKALGLSVDQIVGRHCHELFHCADHPPEGCLHEKLRRSESPETMDMEMNALHGTYMVSVTPVFDDNGQLIRTIHIAKEISSRKKDELELLKLNKSLQESEGKLNAIFNATRDGILVADTHTRKFMTGNRAICEMLGYNIEEIKRLGVMDIHPSEHLSHIVDQFERQLRGELDVAENLPVRRKDGRVFSADISSAPVKFGDQEYLIGIFRDISERKKMEEFMRQAQKMEAIGTLAGGIAHDFNNILSPIMGFTEIALLDLPPDSPARSHLAEVLSSTKRARSLVQQILDFSRKSEQNKMPIQLQPLINEVVKFLRASIPTTIEIRQEIDLDCRPVHASAIQIHQVLMNICTNAYHATRMQGGVIEIILDSSNEKDDKILTHLNLSPGSYARITVRDDGYGIDPLILDRIFDPYFTTKQKEEGSGLGLATVYGIVKEHQGTITVDSELNRGTTMTVYLPHIDMAVVGEEVAEQELFGGSERILLVDDEDKITMVASRMLQMLGYQVRSFNKSVEALQAFQEQPEAFDLVITDLTMPSINGLELARRMLAIREDISVIVCTGFSETLTEHDARNIGVREYILKPFDRHSLGTVVRKVLDT